MVMLVGTVPFAGVQIYSTTLREAKTPMLPMIAGIIAVFVNLFFNYVLIFGHFGAPAMGCIGAGIATVISRVVEFLIISIVTHRSKERFTFLKGLYRLSLIHIYFIIIITDLHGFVKYVIIRTVFAVFEAASYKTERES